MNPFWWVPIIFKHRHKFEVVRSIWPYTPGYAVRCKPVSCHMVLDTVPTKKQAELICDLENELSSNWFRKSVDAREQ